MNDFDNTVKAIVDHPAASSGNTRADFFHGFNPVQDGDIPREGAKVINNKLFFTPSEYRGFQTHLMYESIFYGQIPRYTAQYTLNDCDIRATVNNIKDHLLKLYKTVIWDGFHHNQNIDSRPSHARASSESLIAYDGGCMLHVDLSEGYSNFSLFFNNEAEFLKVRELLETKLLINVPRVIKDRTDNFYMVTHNGRGLDLVEFTINKKKFSSFNIEDSYNDDFGPVALRVEEFINSEETGIVLLHGIAGSGKTTFIRYLLTRSGTKRIIYLPPDLANELASPAFFNFIREYDNSVLLIEDAETILRTREGGGNPAIANLLNLSDGIMGDALNIQIICTFNAPYTEIDAALKRPGRLITSYHFDVLSKEKTKNLVKKFFGEDVSPLKDQMTLAEIYKMKEEKLITEKKATKVGFV